MKESIKKIERGMERREVGVDLHTKAKTDFET